MDAMSVKSVWILVLVMGFAGNYASTTPGRKPLYIGGLLPLTKGSSPDFGPTAFAGCKLAVDDINNRSDVLPDYELIVNWTDTQHNLPITLNKLYEFIYNPPVKVAIFGPLFSSITEVLAEVIGQWNITQISPGASTPVLTDRVKFPHVYRMLTSSAAFGTAQAGIVRQFGWTKIATLNTATEPHKGRINSLKDEESESNFTVIISESFLTDPLDALKRLKAEDARIIATSFYEEEAKKVFCSAYKLDMYGANYVWMIPGYYSANWQDDVEGLDCTAEQLREATEGYLTVAFMMYGNSEDVGRCGRTPSEFRHKMEGELAVNVTLSDPGFAAMGYDGIWALALAMHDVQNEIPMGLDSYKYGDGEYATLVGDSILRQEFDGMSGPILFTDGGYRLGNLLIEQNVNGEEVLIGSYDNIQNMITWVVPTDSLWYYSGGTKPFDSDVTETITTLQATPLPLVIVVSFLSVLGIILATLFLCFNTWKREHRQIKMSSPKVNNIISCGIMFAYICAALLGIDNSMAEEGALQKVCQLRSWLIPLAFTLAFGGMFTKMWRIYSIVIANKTKRKVIKDRYLFGIIVVLLLVDFAILIPWQIIDPIQIEKITYPITQTQDDIENHKKRELLHVNCTSENNTIWIMMMLIYKAFVVVFGAFLAWSTRNINVPGLNDSYYVGLSIYNTVICCVVAVPLSFLSVSSIGVTYGLVSCFMLFCITVSLCMLFLPKVFAVYRKIDAEGGTVSGMITFAAPKGPRNGGATVEAVATTSGQIESLAQK
ncbi:gamma-aminobutyric acid type B receptor subunit 2-like [Asterias rubens]|uniref:gamma-aminobutyric acid type B receptor subunit 2-like n=1 Tax=Asterias rubens TaxID=7604 RepID=UPI0014551E1C|nr:gamma-aminobutyric acid type B receptor subunit 2-like [Asterias rubens]